LLKQASARADKPPMAPKLAVAPEMVGIPFSTGVSQFQAPARKRCFEQQE
jgi:hypothetical protein